MKKELTRIITVQITGIAKGWEAENAASPEKEKEALIKSLRKHYDVDDVVITNVQDFIRDVEEGESNEV